MKLTTEDIGKEFVIYFVGTMTGIAQPRLFKLKSILKNGQCMFTDGRVYLLRDNGSDLIQPVVHHNPFTSKKVKVKTMPSSIKETDDIVQVLASMPSFSATGNITGMKQKYYGKGALLVKRNGYIYNVSSQANIYHDMAK